MSKKKLKIIVIAVLAILIIVLINTCLYDNRENLINGIIGKNHVLQAQENISAVEDSADNSVDISKWNLEKVNIVYDKDNVAVPVPKGYVASRVENGITPIGQEILEENRVNTGFVIYEMTSEEIENGTEVNITKDNFWEESQKRNQWVWVPVPDTSRIYERDSSTGRTRAKLWEIIATGRRMRGNIWSEPGIVSGFDNEKYFAKYGIQGMTREKFLEELEKEFEETMKSIEEYGGFYIGRYETGNIMLKEPVVRRMNVSISNQTWYEMFSKIKNIDTNPNTKTNIIWGCLWDEMLQWLIDTEAKTRDEVAVDSSTWGNYLDSTFDYATLNSEKLNKVANDRKLIPSGSSEQNKANNIYDMAGNVYDWTLEFNGGGRCQRGGNYNSLGSNENAQKNNWNNQSAPNNSQNYIGCRAYLYIK